MSAHDTTSARPQPAADPTAGEPVAADPIAAAVTKMRRVFAAKPETAAGGDPPATARIVDGLACDVVGPNGQAMRTDMPAAAGGAGSAPTPGWYLRAAMASCTATLLRAYAAEQRIELGSVEVTVVSRSDRRGMLGMDGVGAHMFDIAMTIRLSAPGVPAATLRALAERAYRHSPVAATIAAGDAGTLEIDVAD